MHNKYRFLTVSKTLENAKRMIIKEKETLVLEV